jgi:hypothetical protein
VAQCPPSPTCNTYVVTVTFSIRFSGFEIELPLNYSAGNTSLLAANDNQVGTCGNSGRIISCGMLPPTATNPTEKVHFTLETIKYIPGQQSVFAPLPTQYKLALYLTAPKRRGPYKLVAP